MKIRSLWFELTCLTAVTLAGCGGATTGERDATGSETDWLAQCEVDSDCEVGQCFCGVCTRVCESADECDEAQSDATCLRAEALQGCERAPKVDRGICLDQAALETVERQLDPSATSELEAAYTLPGLSRVELLATRSTNQIDPKGGLKLRCLGEALPVHSVDGVFVPSCSVLEVSPSGADCDAGREPADEALAGAVREHLRAAALCSDPDGDCEELAVCAIEAFEPGSEDAKSCLTSPAAAGNGWCYIDPEQGLGREVLVDGCPFDQRRRIRFVGSATPRPGALAVLACNE